jgi:hypothetical protein
MNVREKKNLCCVCRSLGVCSLHLHATRNPDAWASVIYTTRTSEHACMSTATDEVGDACGVNLMLGFRMDTHDIT